MIDRPDLGPKTFAAEEQATQKMLEDSKPAYRQNAIVPGSESNVTREETGKVKQQIATENRHLESEKPTPVKDLPDATLEAKGNQYFLTNQKHLKYDDWRRTNSHAYLVGGGIASLAAAAYLIRDGGLSGNNITILEKDSVLGGSLDGSGSPDQGYIVRGGRMFEPKYQCTYDLFTSIPTLDKSKTVTQDMFDFSDAHKWDSKARLVKDGHPLCAPEYGLREKDILALERLCLEPEWMLGKSSIKDHFDADFFKSNFWSMWATTFSFQPDHSAVEFKRYLERFIHMVPGFNQLHGIMRTPYNQYDALVRPLQQWLKEKGVKFQTDTTVQDLALKKNDGEEGRVEKILYSQNGKPGEIAVGPDDFVIATLGSMTEASAAGDNNKAAPLNGKPADGSFALWEKIAAGRPEFGKPGVFDDHIDQSKWVSSTTTLHDPTMTDWLRNYTGNETGTGGLITFADSNWGASIVFPAQPHFIGQPKDVNVFWGYGLHPDTPGNFVKKPMQECSGREILTEYMGLLHVPAEEQKKILDSSTTIPNMMPYITSEFLPREKGDRPQVLPKGWKNLAFTGQFVEQPDDTVFTVDYSVRSAANAVYGLLGMDRHPPAVYKGQYDPRVLFRAFKELHDMNRGSCHRDSAANKAAADKEATDNQAA